MSEVNQRRIGRYRVERLLGAGGFATVLEAVDDRLEDRVAIKILAENHSLDPDVRERFLAEGRVLRRIDSPYVVRVLDLGETDRQQPYLVLELADRGTLEARVAALRERGWRAGPDDVLALVGPLGAALTAVHRAAVVHRDLSPGNVLLRSTLAPDTVAGRATLLADDERLLLADLGLSKDLARSSGITVAGGTEGFRPPEQRGAPGTIDARADLWSASALVTWLVAGERPHDQAHARTLLTAGPLPAPAVDALVRSLSTEPADRHADIAGWAAQVSDALTVHRVPAPPQPPSPEHAARSAAPGPKTARRRAPRVGWLLGALLLGGVLGAGAWALQTADPAMQVEHADDGTVRVHAGDDELAVILHGPETIAVGQTAEFRAEGHGAATIVWIAPDGQVHTGTDRLDVTASSPGTARVTVLGTAPGGREVTATHQLRVTS